jgi:hypothetical protein
MKNLLTFIALSLIIIACSSEEEQQTTDLKSKISEQEERVSELSKDIQNAEKTDSAKVELVNVLLDYYHKFPKDDYSANCLSKVHMIYSGLENTEEAAAYADTLIENYPDFVDRAQMIESQIDAYERVVKPRNPEMVKKYIKLWLKENEDAPIQKIEDMQYHLKHADVSVEERIRLNMTAPN